MASTIKSDNGVSSGVTGIVQTADSSGQLALQTTTSGGTATTAITIDNSQNVGVGVTPSAWGSTNKAIEFSYASFANNSGGGAYVAANVYLNGSSQWIYKSTAAASLYQQSSGTHYFYNAISGTSGTAASLTQAMTLNNSGTLIFNQSGQGIQFTNSSALTNSTLNDYETGTWTTTFSAYSNGNSASLSNATYIKIGKQVTLFGEIAFTKTSASGVLAYVNFTIPFATNSGVANCGIVTGESGNRVAILSPYNNGSSISACYFVIPVSSLVGATTDNYAFSYTYQATF